MNQRGFTGIVLLIIVLILVGLSGAYYFGKLPAKLSIPQPQASVSPTSQPTQSDETAGWKTYTSNNIKVSFKYPPDWNLSEGEKAVYSVHLSKDPDFREIIGACPGYSLSVSPFDPIVNYVVFSPVQKGLFNGEPVEIYEITNKYGCYTKVIFVNQFPTDSLKPRLVITLVSKTTNPGIFKQILSTFQFTP